MPLWVRATAMTLLFPGMVAGLVPYLLARGGWALPFDAPACRWLALPVLVLGVIILARTIWSFAFRGKGTLAPWDAPVSLVHNDLYQWVRNPMYIGVLAIIFGQALLWSSGGVLAYAVVMALGFHVRVVQYEEPALRNQFGETFAVYMRAVPRWIPRRPGRSVNGVT